MSPSHWITLLTCSSCKMLCPKHTCTTHTTKPKLLQRGLRVEAALLGLHCKEEGERGRIRTDGHETSHARVEANNLNSENWAMGSVLCPSRLRQKTNIYTISATALKSPTSEVNNTDVIGNLAPGIYVDVTFDTSNRIHPFLCPVLMLTRPVEASTVDRGQHGQPDLIQCLLTPLSGLCLASCPQGDNTGQNYWNLKEAEYLNKHIQSL